MPIHELDLLNWFSDKYKIVFSSYGEGIQDSIGFRFPEL